MKVYPGCVIVTGLLCTPHKPTLPAFLAQLQQCLHKTEIILLDEWNGPASACPFLRLMLPRSTPHHYDPYLTFSLTAGQEELLRRKEFLSDSAAVLCAQYRSMTDSYAKTLVCSVYELYSSVIDCWKPACVVVWNSFSPLHEVCVQACREKNVPLLFMEFGVLPGTFALELTGEMGHSSVAVNRRSFLKLPIEQPELEHAQAVLDFLRNSGLNRYVQSRDARAETKLRSLLAPRRPVVLFAGQNDFDSGMVPYTAESADFHSPVFTSSLAAVEFLADLAEKNGWNFIFKPHPAMAAPYKGRHFAPNTIYIEQFDLNALIDLADAVVTIASQTAYIALLRERPVVMLGYTQLRGKGCSYEAFSKDDIEAKIKTAIQQGQTEEQKEHFVRHTAQLLKYYLFDDLSERPLRYGRTLDHVSPDSKTIPDFLRSVEFTKGRNDALSGG